GKGQDPCGHAELPHEDSGSQVLTEMSDDSKIIEEIVRAHYDNCDYTRNKMEPFLARAKENPVYVPCTGMG
ncbi:Ecdysone-induced protein E75a, partial [Caligus rogercresseyi]